MIAAVGVVVPVHDEIDHIPHCLAAVERALKLLPSSVRRLVVVVLDDCSDGSEQITKNWSGDAAIEGLGVQFRNVGRARAAGMSHALQRFSSLDRQRVWLATTDADSVVPATWLTAQLRLAEAGAEAFAGTIRVEDWGAHPSGLSERFMRFYEPPNSSDAHPHVHGANLGVRGDVYEASGGFEPLTTGEDHALWRALQRIECSRISTRLIAVTTSARTHARAPKGFSGFLAQMGGD